MSNPIKNLTKSEWGLWLGSLLIIAVSNIWSGDSSLLTLIAAWIGITSLIFAVKGNVWAQILMIVFSTISIATSFIAASLTMLRSSYFALGYASNDIVLIILWGLASIENPVYLPVVVNFVIFFFNDMYGFISWKKREVNIGDEN